MEFIPTISVWVAFTRDLETQGHVMVYVTCVISVCIDFVLSRWTFCCFVRILGQGIYSDYCNLGDSVIWPWNSRSRHGLRDLCYFCLYWFCPIAMNFLLFRKDFRSRNLFWLLQLGWLSYMTLKLKVTSWPTWRLLFLLIYESEHNYALVVVSWCFQVKEFIL